MNKKAFTLIELLVVISIIALLLSIMLPSLSRAREAGRRVVCGSGMRNISLAIMQYSHDFGDTLHSPTNSLRWYDLGRFSKNSGRVLSPDETYAYWGLAYASYGAEKDVFKCPSKKTNDSWWNAVIPAHDKAFDHSDYGLNMFLVWKLPSRAYQSVTVEERGTQTLRTFRQPSQTIMFHDHFEPTLEGNGDSYYIREGDTINLQQWRTYAEEDPGQRGNAIRECWRHGGYMGENRGSSNIMWLDGHVSSLRETTGEDVSYAWYHGGVFRGARQIK
jgi:prepilin-type N-terminal cleavage/methylation domain-containing protein/prepilin-type processing-associated H-X9-DG protein